MELLVTGGAGFIGSHLCRRLFELGYGMEVIDDLSRGKGERLRGLVKGFRPSSLGDIPGLEKAVQSCDAVVHLAAVSQVRESINDPARTRQTNIAGTSEVARLCSKYGKNLVFASSREVYGNPAALPCPESSPLQPLNPYSASKIAGEERIGALNSSGPFPYTILRLANVYGPGDFGRVVPIFISNARAGHDLEIFGEEKIVDFVYISDVVDAILKAIGKPAKAALNIGSGKGTSLQELARMANARFGNRSSVRVLPPRGGEVDRFVADVSKAEKMLGWKPRILLGEGLGLAIAGEESQFR